MSALHKEWMVYDQWANDVRLFEHGSEAFAYVEQNVKVGMVYRRKRVSVKRLSVLPASSENVFRRLVEARGVGNGACGRGG